MTTQHVKKKKKLHICKIAISFESRNTFFFYDSFTFMLHLKIRESFYLNLKTLLYVNEHKNSHTVKCM